MHKYIYNCVQINYCIRNILLKQKSNVGMKKKHKLDNNEN